MIQDKLKLNIAQKLLAGFGIVFLFIIANGILTFGILTRSKSQNRTVTQEYYPTAKALSELEGAIEQSKMLIKNWVYIERQPSTPDKQALVNLIQKEYPALKSELEKFSGEWESEEQAALQEVFTQFNQSLVLQQQVIDNLNSFEAYDDMMIQMESESLVEDGGEIIATADSAIDKLKGLIELYRGKSDDALVSMNRSFTGLSIFVVLMSFLVSGLAAVVVYVLYRSIVMPLKQSVAFAQQIGRGDLTARVEVTQEDEIGQLALALTQMADNLKKTVDSIKKNASELVRSGGVLRSSSLQLSKGSSEQAASAEEVSTSIEEMVANIDQNTENAILTEKITQDTAANVNLSNELSSEAARAMKIIAEKITIISDIAFQTNILALNAAVEAARAGEHGRGFSVVAAEVRKLAERSKQAADEIVGLVKKGMKVSQEAGEKARQLVPDIQKTTQLIKEISAASVEQKTGAEQINLAMQQLNVITQENASASDELTQSSEQLSRLAANLKAAVGYFNAGETEADADADDEGATLRVSEAAPARPRKREARTGSRGVDINLSSQLEREFDLENYEKF